MAMTGSDAWTPGTADVAVILVAMNEAHHIDAIADNLRGWAREVFLVDSYSSDDTVGRALSHGFHVVQHAFRGFGDQWNFALETLPIQARWTLKLDPDERLSAQARDAFETEIARDRYDALRLPIRLWFLGTPLPVVLTLLRAWRTGKCRFSDVAVNEHALVEGRIGDIDGEIEHHDAPSLEHWFDKQNRYSTAEAWMRYSGAAMAVRPKLSGNALERRMWLKANFWKLPGRFFFLYVYHLVVQGAWRAGRAGRMWARLRTDVFRMQAYKYEEMQLRGGRPPSPPRAKGQPDPRVRQFQ